MEQVGSHLLLTANEMTMPMRALKHTALLAFFLLVAAPASAEVALRFSPANTTVEVGSINRLSIVCDDTLDLRTIEVFVEFDPAVVGSVSGGPGTAFTDSGFALFQGFELTQPNQWQGYCVVLGAGDFITSPGELFYWEFEGLADGISPITSASIALVAPGSVLVPDVTLGPTTITVGDDTSPVPTNQPFKHALDCYPNPFNPVTRISFFLPREETVRLNIYGVCGGLVSTLVDETRGPGAHEVIWNGCNDAGQIQPSGLYFYRIETGSYSEVRKMTLIK